MDVPTETPAMRKAVTLGIATLAAGIAFGGGYVVGVGAARRGGDTKARDSIRTLAMLVQNRGALTDVERTLVEFDEELRRSEARLR
jgi:hypothetical protein